MSIFKLVISCTKDVWRLMGTQKQVSFFLIFLGMESRLKTFFVVTRDNTGGHRSTATSLSQMGGSLQQVNACTVVTKLKKIWEGHHCMHTWILQKWKQFTSHFIYRWNKSIHKSILQFVCVYSLFLCGFK